VLKIYFAADSFAMVTVEKQNDVKYMVLSVSTPECPEEN
jgi:hypothetical protein